MTIEIKQVDIEFLAGIREAMGQKIIADELRAGRSDADNWPWKPLTVLATQRSTYEARIAELERERDAAIRSKVAAMDARDTEEARAESAEARLAEAVETFEQMRPHVEKILIMITARTASARRGPAGCGGAMPANMSRPATRCPRLMLPASTS